MKVLLSLVLALVSNAHANPSEGDCEPMDLEKGEKLAYSCGQNMSGESDFSRVCITNKRVVMTRVSNDTVEGSVAQVNREENSTTYFVRGAVDSANVEEESDSFNFNLVLKNKGKGKIALTYEGNVPYSVDVTCTRVK